MNHTDEHLILVPFQFSAPSECALQHAVAVAKAAQDRILLLHVVNSETKDLMKREQLTLKNLYDKLRRLADSISSQHGVAADFEMEEGSIFTTIPEYAEKSKARLIIMGTHGIHGLQHIIGPNASELIGECVVAMEFGAASEDLARICHAHPTLSEVVHEAALACDKRPLHF